MVWEGSMVMKIAEKIMNDVAFELTHGREITAIHLSKDYWIAIAHEVIPYSLTYVDGQPKSLFGIPVIFIGAKQSHHADFGYTIRSYLTKEEA
jgi:hypothetical protein